jgi:sugar lactone lactonase YvrE
VNSPGGVVVEASGNVIFADTNNRRVRQVSGTNIYIADTFDNRILKYDGSSTTVVAGTGAPGYGGDNGPVTNATLFLPDAVSVDSRGNLFIADTRNSAIRMVDTAGKITTIAGTGCTPARRPAWWRE